jgi:hypothetical protein
VFWSTIDFIAATLVGIGPACAPALNRVAPRMAVLSGLNSLMTNSVLFGIAWRVPGTVILGWRYCGNLI